MFAVLMFGVGALGAKRPGHVVLDATCTPPGVALEDIQRILEAELAPSEVVVRETGQSATNEDDAIIILDGCTDEPPGVHAAFVWHDAMSDRRVDLVDAAVEERPCIVALALAEGIRRAPESREAAPNAAIAPKESAAPTTGTEPVPNQRPSPTSASGTAPRLHVAANARYAPRAKTLLGGAELGVAWQRSSVGLIAFGTQRSSSLGDARLLVLAATGSTNVIQFGDSLAMRAVVELGAAIGSGTAYGGASSFTVLAPHVAVALGLGGLFRVGDGWMLQTFAGAGYASVSPCRGMATILASPGGAFVTAALGVEFPL